jgi:spore coat polysaccharide biosynthesis predicted glycosyltransferase SpsG
MPIPDRIYLYGEYWREELLSNNFWGDDLIPTGSLRMERYRNLKSDRKHAEICNILVTTQGIDVANLCLFLVEFLKIIRGQINIILTIKLHPREHNSRIYNEIFTEFDNIRIVSGYSMPSTFDLLIESDFHASISSTCHYEALALGIPTLILPFPSNEKVLHLTKTGYAFTIQNPRQMAECVINNLHITVPIPIGDNYFRSNALNNILANLSNG